MLPFVILSIMALILSHESIITNKEILSSNSEINYPIFGIKEIDNYIASYLNNSISSEGKTLIDYDYNGKENVYYLTFYKYVFSGAVIKSSTDNFIVDINNSKVEKTAKVSYEYDIVHNKFVSEKNKLIALTFDDGPNYNSNKVLDILEKYHIPATFFVLGSRIKGNEYILNRIIKSGSEIGNHTYSHSLLTKYKEDKIKEEIESTSKLIYDSTGRYPSLLRPSYGSFNSKIKKVSNYPIIIWDIDTLDWKYHNSKKIASRVLNKVKDGDIVLMHDIYSATANALNIIIPELQSRGYTFVTVSELFYYKEVSLEKGKVYGYAR